jgi:amino acid permease
MKLKLSDTILLYLMVALMIIGGHQTYLIAQEEGLRTGFIKSYWIYMIVMVLMTIYQIRKGKAAKKEKDEEAKNSKPGTGPSKTKSKVKRRQK